MSKDKGDILREELVAADREDLRRARLFEELLESPAWKIFEELLNYRVQSQADMLLQPEQLLNLAAEGKMPTNSEFVKGTMNGLILARDYPSTIIRTVRAQLGNKSDAPNKTEQADDEENLGDSHDPAQAIRHAP